VLLENRSDPVSHLVWGRWQSINLQIHGGMIIRSAMKGAARMRVSRFDVPVTVTDVSSTSLWVMVPAGWRKTSTPPCHRPPRIERGMEPTGGLEPPAFSLPMKWSLAPATGRAQSGKRFGKSLPRIAAQGIG
jgi:hypothetical protein